MFDNNHSLIKPYKTLYIEFHTCDASNVCGGVLQGYCAYLICTPYLLLEGIYYPYESTGLDGTGPAIGSP